MASAGTGRRAGSRCLFPYGPGSPTPLVRIKNHPENTPYRDYLRRYHANFELAGEGEFPALVTPDHTIAHAYTEHNGGYPINYFLTECK